MEITTKNANICRYALFVFFQICATPKTTQNQL